MLGGGGARGMCIVLGVACAAFSLTDLLTYCATCSAAEPHSACCTCASAPRCTKSSRCSPAPSFASTAASPLKSAAWVATGSGIGDFRERRLARAPEVVAGHPVARPLTLGVLNQPEPPGAPWGGAGAELGHCRAHFNPARVLIRRGLALLERALVGRHEPRHPGPRIERLACA